jgi:hypothetical protein
MKFIEKELKKMWKKEILMGFRIVAVLLGVLLIFSCATQKELGNNAHEVRLELADANPYCGGAAPDPEMELPIYVPMSNASYLLYVENEDGSRGKELKEIKTNEEGVANLTLPKGKYQLWLPSKKLSLDDFIKAESPDRGQNYSYSDKECFQAWREKVDFTFEVKSDTTIALSRPTRCYTDAHPCLKYDGPYRP